MDRSKTQLRDRPFSKHPVILDPKKLLEKHGSSSVRRGIRSEFRGGSKQGNVSMVFHTPERLEPNFSPFTPNETSPRQQRKMDKLSDLIVRLENKKRSQSNVRTKSLRRQLRSELKPPEDSALKNDKEQKQEDVESEDEIKPLYLKGTITPVGEEEKETPPQLALPDDKNFDNMVVFMKKLLSSVIKRKNEPRVLKTAKKADKKVLCPPCNSQSASRDYKPKPLVAFEESLPAKRKQVNLSIDTTANEIRPTNLTVVHSTKANSSNSSKWSINTMPRGVNLKKYTEACNTTKARNTVKITFEPPQKHCSLHVKGGNCNYNGSKKCLKSVQQRQNPSIIIQNGVILMPGVRVNNNKKLTVTTNRTHMPPTTKKKSVPAAALNKKRRNESKTSAMCSYSSSRALLKPAQNLAHNSNTTDKGTCFKKLKKIFNVGEDEPMQLVPALKIETELLKFSVADAYFNIPRISYEELS